MHGHPTEKPPLRGSYIKYVANHLIFYVFILHKVLRHIGHSPGVNGVREIEGSTTDDFTRDTVLLSN